eukprot:TRINITY_DN4104_c0_g1_i1.p1 TRINITY_DN4104_c0_g1~~TRINITY_DN4104_c0_g1_i1.p1  ORF type:complete len:164 (-),score=34.71 TRINITY_DN4104_c0_g1_i1:50-541(-)
MFVYKEKLVGTISGWMRSMYIDTSSQSQKKWTRKWWRLDPCERELKFSDDRDDLKKGAGAINLDEVGTVSKVNAKLEFPDQKDLHRQLMFTIAMKGKRWFFQCESINHRNDWVAMLVQELSKSDVAFNEMRRIEELKRQNSDDESEEPADPKKKSKKPSKKDK